MTEIAWRAAIVVALAAFVGVTWLLLHRRHKKTWSPRVPRMAREDLKQTPDPLLIVVFTSRFCVACTEVLRTATTTAPEIPLQQIRLSDHREAAERYGLVETPTLLLVDERLRIRYSAIGLVDEQELWFYVREAWDSSTQVRRLEAKRAKTG